MRPLEIYRLGLRLAGSATSEAERRNVIGRLYYGLHHEAAADTSENIQPINL